MGVHHDLVEDLHLLASAHDVVQQRAGDLAQLPQLGEGLQLGHQQERQVAVPRAVLGDLPHALGGALPEELEEPLGLEVHLAHAAEVGGGHVVEGVALELESALLPVDPLEHVHRHPPAGAQAEFLLAIFLLFLFALVGHAAERSLVDHTPQVQESAVTRPSRETMMTGDDVVVVESVQVVPGDDVCVGVHHDEVPPSLEQCQFGCVRQRDHIAIIVFRVVCVIRVIRVIRVICVICVIR